MSYWSTYWSTKTHGGHRKQDEAFLGKEAAEKLFHLAGGTSVLDFGCGSADLFAYFAAAYPVATGADFSASMLANARERLKEHPHAELIEADDRTVWGSLTRSYDRITCSAVVQYFTPAQLEAFIRGASAALSEDGRIVLFDVIHPTFYPLWKLCGSQRRPGLVGTAYRFLGARWDALRNAMKGKPGDEIGFSFYPAALAQIAEACDLELEIVWSMYYEYRYHAILTRRQRPAA